MLDIITKIINESTETVDKGRFTHYDRDERPAGAGQHLTGKGEQLAATRSKKPKTEEVEWPDLETIIQESGMERQDAINHLYGLPGGWQVLVEHYGEERMKRWQVERQIRDDWTDLASWAFRFNDDGWRPPEAVEFFADVVSSFWDLPIPEVEPLL